MSSYGQEALLRLLRIEPAYANGYFILDKKKMDQEGVTSVKIIALVDKMLPNGAMERRTLGQFPVTNGHFWKLDPALKSALTPNETLHYRVIGSNSLGEDVVEAEELCEGCWGWPAVCSVSCNSAAYAWTLTAVSNGAQTAIRLENGHEDGQPFYFYVPLPLWPEFTTSHTPSDFSLAGNWSGLETMAQTYPPNPYQPTWEFLFIPPSPDGSNGGLNGQEHMLNGYPVGGLYVGDGAYAIRKDRGPWKHLNASTGNLAQPAQICQILKEAYNGDDAVQASMDINGIPDLACAALPGAPTGSVDWGSGVSSCFSSISLSDYGGNLVAWGDAVMDCFSTSTSTGGSGAGNGSGGLADVADVTLSQWGIDSHGTIVHVSPNSEDPKLVSVPRTVAEPGLYEARIRLKDGTILRHFEEFTAQLVITADFSDFVDIVVYPVPVKEPVFSVDFDLNEPRSIAMTVVNNLGDVYYANEFGFDLAGRNKHVVHMTEPWPNGLYHAHFQFSDGTVRSRSIVVNMD
jgi:hypothetical protein